MTVFSEGRLIYMAVIPFAGEVITRDIKEGCSILQKWAEQLKIQYGQAMGDFAEEEKVVTIPGHSGWEPKEISFKSLAYIIQARLEEIIDSLLYQIEKSGLLSHSAQGDCRERRNLQTTQPAPTGQIQNRNGRTTRILTGTCRFRQRL